MRPGRESAEVSDERAYREVLHRAAGSPDRAVAQMGGLAEAQFATAIEAIARRDTKPPNAPSAAISASTGCSRRSRTGR